MGISVFKIIIGEVYHQKYRRKSHLTEMLIIHFSYFYLGPSINGLVTDGNTKLCCRGFILALFQSTTANKIDSEHTQDSKRRHSWYMKLKYTSYSKKN